MIWYVGIFRLPYAFSAMGKPSSETRSPPCLANVSAHSATSLIGIISPNAAARFSAWHAKEKTSGMPIGMPSRGSFGSDASNPPSHTLKQYLTPTLKTQAAETILPSICSSTKGAYPCMPSGNAWGCQTPATPWRRSNDLLVSSRQKGKGMSWSQDESSALAMVRMTMRNRQQRIWLEKRKISIEFLADAA